VSDYSGCANPECLDNGGRLVAMAAAARQLASRLKVYASVETKPEFLSALVEAVDEFKRCRISSQDLMAASMQTQGTLAEKLEELSLLLGAYDSLCSRGKRDPRDRETMLLEQMEDCDFAENHVFYIDGFPDFTRQHLAILEHLILHSPNVTVGLNCDRIDSGAMAFEKAGATAAELIRCAQRCGVEYKVEYLQGRQDALSSVCHALFQGPATKVSQDLTVLHCQSVSDEITLAAERIMELVQHGCRYRDIGIVAGDMGVYQDPMDLIFHRCNIPLYRSGKEDILGKTVICTVISALESALGGFEQRDVLQYLKSILSPLDADTCDQLENYAVIWGIRGKAWLREWVNHPDGLSGQWTDEARERLNLLNRAREMAIVPLHNLYRDFEEAKNLGQQVMALYRFLEHICLADRLEMLAKELDERNNNRDAQILNQLWDILTTALEQLYDILGETEWKTEHFTRLLTLLLSQYDVGTIPTVLDAVSAGQVSAQRCQQVKHLIVLGATEGALPGYAGSTGLLSDPERVALRKLGVPLTGGAMEGIQAEFAEIYGVFCGATHTITVSYSDQPSYVCRRLAQMAGGEMDAKPVLGCAAQNTVDAAAYLVKLGAEDVAQQLGLQGVYHATRERADYALGVVSQEQVRTLYGRQLRLSASQIDRHAECRMSYFLQYGLRARERKEATVDPAEFGTYVHAVLEKTARDVMRLGGFAVVSLEETLDIAMKHSDQYAQERFVGMDSDRLTYLFRRNRRELEMVVEELWQELKSSRFTPSAFELRFGDGGSVDGIAIHGEKMHAVLRGLVDRVDVWEENGKHYFRIVDYKTGKKDFDYCDVFNGVGLQMLIYLFALDRSVFGTAAGVQYFPARVPLLNVDGKCSDEEARSARAKEWKRKGLLLSDEEVLDAMDPQPWERLCATRKKDGTISGDLADREQLQMLSHYVFDLLGRMVDDIASGNVDANPYTRGTSHDACTFCPYGSICHQSQLDSRRNYKTMTAQRFWEEVKKEVDRRG
jgi:ATP-dependent helicase/nuclease subunit B